MQSGQIVYQGTSKKAKNILIRYIQQGDAEVMMEYINTLSQEQTFIRFQGETLSLEEEQQFGFVEYGMLPKGILYKGAYEDYVYLYKNI